MADRDLHAADCGCCAGVDTETPGRVQNPPGQPRVSYRVGTHVRFRESLLARLSSSDYPALRSLSTRADDDLSIALCDALASALDVLTFYQERIVNEQYLRTATEERSVSAIARLIGYVPSSGVAASTYLAFTLQEAPGDRSRSAEPVTIPRGTRVQSVPGPEEKAQVFETTEDTKARVEWNAVPAQLSEPWRPVFGDTDLYLDGVGTQLQPGDAILIVGKERETADSGSERWEVRVLASVEPDPANNRTRVTWTDGLGHFAPRVQPAAQAVQVFAFRQRAALFGHNAPDPNLMIKESADLGNLTEGDPDNTPLKRWIGYRIPEAHIDLDAAYPRITAGSWVVLVSNENGQGSPSLPGYVELYRANEVRQVSRAGFGLSTRITRITPDTDEHLDARFRLRETLVLAQSEALRPVARPLLHPVYGNRLKLDLLIDGLNPNRHVTVSGRRQRVAVARGVNDLTFVRDSGETVTLGEGDSLVLLAAPTHGAGSTWTRLDPEEFGGSLGIGDRRLRLTVLDRDGRSGTLECPATAVVLEASRKDDPTVAEIALLVSSPDQPDDERDRTTINFADSLAHCYERASVRVNANVVPASHGETVQEILGGGDAARPDQSFTLRQSPLTYVQTAAASGRTSTLEVRVNDLLWREVATLYGRGPDERVFTVATNQSGAGEVRFGDGVEGARLPSGQANVRATYRKGLGTAGTVAAGRLTNLLTRALGVAAATNPEAATGGQDRESLEAARQNAPLTVLTLDRAVSVQDYADFARAFAGIAKAHALWIPAGPGRGVFLTIAGISGAPLSESSDTYQHLFSALRTYGDPLVSIHLMDYRRAAFRASLAIKVASDRQVEKVLPAVGKELRKKFGFDERDFGQGVSIDEVTAVAHRVDGVEAAKVTRLSRVGSWPAVIFQLESSVAKPAVASLKGPVRLPPLFRLRPIVQPRLFAELPVASLKEMPRAAELLTLDADSLELTEIA
jgi:hypothetical protein